MRKTRAAIACCIALAAAPAIAKGGHSGTHSSHASSHAHSGEHAVAGHVTKNGTYVAPHHATNPNHDKHDNYSSKGNVNPHTGKEGTQDPNK